MDLARGAAVLAVALTGSLVPDAAWARAPGGVTRAPAAVAVVRAEGPLNVRVGPATWHDRVGALPPGTRLTVACQARGQTIRSNPLWNRLADGLYVTDSYVAWRPARPALPSCALSPGSTVDTGGGPLNVRAGAGTAYRRLATLRHGTRLDVACQVFGQRIRSNPLWNRLADGRFVADSYVAWRPTRPAVPWCDQQPPLATPANQAAFVARIAGPARENMRRHGIPASVTMAQAIVESGWGRSGLTRVDHNYFGIKCFGAPGPVAAGCRSYPTTECANGRCFPTTATFRVYRAPADSFADHGRFLTGPRYRRAFADLADPNRFAAEIHRAGYATGPRYTESLVSLMRTHDLYRFDR